MIRDNLWEENYQAFLSFMAETKKRPSKHRLEERKMLNWLKYQKKRFAKGLMKPERIGRFTHLLELAEQYLRKNQYAYTHKRPDEGNFYSDLFGDESYQEKLPTRSATDEEGGTHFN